MVLLYDISTELFAGQAFQGRIENDPEGDCRMIQMRDLDNSYTKIQNLPHLVKSWTINSKQILRKGDVLFITKGGKNFAFVFNEEYKAAVSSIFFIIRTDSQKVLPGFLAWYINQSPAQTYLRSCKEGTSITNINRLALENLQIPVTPLKVQEEIIAVSNLLQKEISIAEEVLRKKQLLIEKILLTKINL